MTELRPDDYSKAVSNLPHLLVCALIKHGITFTIAGGYLRSIVANERVNDIDVFVSAKSDAETLAGELETNTANWIVTKNAITVTKLGTPIQFIYRWEFYSAAEVLDHFDFTITQAALWMEGLVWKSMCSDDFYLDIALKHLVYTNPSDDPEPGSSMKRVLKMTRRGYNVTQQSLADIIFSIAEPIFIGKDVEIDRINAEIYESLAGEVSPSRGGKT